MTTKAPPLTKYGYRRRLPHLQKAGTPLFVTFCAAGFLLLAEEAPRSRSRTLPPRARRDYPCDAGTLTGEGLDWRPRIHLYTAVVMPDHVHLLLLPLRDENGWPFPLVDLLQCLKSTSAHRVNKLLRTSGPVWEEESFDHVLRSDESLKQKCEYIRQNPVKAGLVRRPEDYRWLWIDPEFKF